MKRMSRMTKTSLGGGLGLLLAFALAGPAAAQSWTELSPTGGPPPARQAHSAVYDPTTNVMIAFAGVGLINPPDGPVFNDVWVLTNADGQGGTPTWTQLFPTPDPSFGVPVPRLAHSAVFDSSTNTMTVFGGGTGIGSCGTITNDVWVLENGNGQSGIPAWRRLLPTGPAPAARRGSGVVYDPGSNRMIVFDGQPGQCGPNIFDLWVLENANGVGAPSWTQLSPTGGPPQPAQHQAGYDAANNRMIVWAEIGGNIASPELWVLENANGLGGTPNWAQISYSGATPIVSSTRGVYDQASNRMYLFSGADESGVLSDVWVLDNANGLGGTPNWTLLSPAPDPVSGLPPGRTGHTVVFNPVAKRLIAFAGRAGPVPCCPDNIVNDVWVLDANPPQLCVSFTGFCDGLEVFVTSGIVYGTWRNLDCVGSNHPGGGTVGFGDATFEAELPGFPNQPFIFDFDIGAGTFDLFMTDGLTLVQIQNDVGWTVSQGVCPPLTGPGEVSTIDSLLATE